MVKMALVRAALGCASFAAIACVSTQASAQQVDRIVAFGDSYVDDGNLWQLIGTPPPAPYSTGRFSGGTNYVDTLSTILDVPVDNFGIGGALTDNRNTNSPLLPGFVTEWNAFLAGGGGPFPTVSGTFDENDLLVVSVGGNDARYYQQQGGTLAGAPIAAQASAAFATAGLNALVNAGAPTISFLAGDTSLLPEIANDPSAQAVRSAYSTSFNSAIQQTLAGYAADGVIVHYLDGSTLLSQVSDNLSAYGLTGLACPALPNTSCIADPSQAYLFYFDQLHLTSAGFAIVGRYVAAQLDAPLMLQAPADLALGTAKQWGRTLTSRLDVNGRAGGETGLRLFAVGDYFSRDIGRTSHNEKFDIDGVGGTLGAEYGFGNGAVGAAVNYTKPRVSFGRDIAHVDNKSWQLGAYGGYAANGLFGQGYLGYGWDSPDIDRKGVISKLSASPDGHHVVAGAKAGYLFPVWIFQVGPLVALDYAKAKVDSYTENGDAVLALNVDSQSVKSTRGQLGIESRGELIPGVRSYTQLTAEKELSGNGRTIHFSQVTAPIIVNRWGIPGDKETYARWTSGANVDLWKGATLNYTMSSTFFQDDNELSLQIGFKTAL